MRLSVFIPEHSPQLFIDLQKLYQGYLAESELTTEALETRINNPQTLFFVTLFNARHLGAVEVEIEGNRAWLNYLCVREITRRRGVGKNLIREVEKHLSDKGIKKVTLALENIKENEQIAVTEFMQICGYQLIDSHFIKKL
jgi:GNAT superfamily N-acetyltransferase